MRYVIEVKCDNPLIDMAVEDAVDLLEQEVALAGDGSVTLTIHEED